MTINFGDEIVDAAISVEERAKLRPATWVDVPFAGGVSDRREQLGFRLIAAHAGQSRVGAHNPAPVKTRPINADDGVFDQTAIIIPGPRDLGLAFAPLG